MLELLRNMGAFEITGGLSRFSLLNGVSWPLPSKFGGAISPTPPRGWLESLPSFWVSELEMKGLGFSRLSFPGCLSLVLLLKKLSGFDGDV